MWASLSSSAGMRFRKEGASFAASLEQSESLLAANEDEHVDAVLVRKARKFVQVDIRWLRHARLIGLGSRRSTRGVLDVEKKFALHPSETHQRRKWVHAQDVIGPTAGQARWNHGMFACHSLCEVQTFVQEHMNEGPTEGDQHRADCSAAGQEKGGIRGGLDG